MPETATDFFQTYLDNLKGSLPNIEDDSFAWDDVIGLLVIKLRNTDSLNKTRKASHATQIQLTSEKAALEGVRKTEDFFPTLTLNTSFKSWRIAIPVRISSKNVEMLKGEETGKNNTWEKNSVQIRRRLLNDDEQGNGNPALHICYGEDLMPLREVLAVDDYLVLTKRKNSTIYEAFGVKSDVDLGNGKQMYVSNKASSDSSVFSLEELVVLDETDKKVEKKNCLEIHLNPRRSKKHPLNLIIYGAPGTGKTYSTAEYALAIIGDRSIDKSRKPDEQRRAIMEKYNDYVRKGQIVFTTFHQSYGYEEFIQGLRPDTESEQMSFVTVDGVFKRIADTALNNDLDNYVIIIDEINRANISKVFGELITLIEEDKRWGEINETCATLQSGDVFAVPNNLYIIGTMNSADKSISLIDAALRRRFEFVEQYPDETLIDDPTLRVVLTKLNAYLADSLESSDLLIGHSYFMGKTADDLCVILNNSIIPLLYEYFYDNKKKIMSVLKETLKNLNIRIIDDKISRVRVEKADVQA